MIIGKIKICTPLALGAAFLLAINLPMGGGVAQTAIETQRVTFAAGTNSILLQGQLKGDQTLDYKLRAGAGQTLTVDLKGSNLQNYFNVMAAGSENALFIGSSSGNSFRGLLPSDGDVNKAVASDQPEPLAVQRRGDVSLLRLGDNFEDYEIVDALVLGG